MVKHTSWWQLIIESDGDGESDGEAHWWQLISESDGDGESGEAHWWQLIRPFSNGTKS